MKPWHQCAVLEQSKEGRREATFAPHLSSKGGGADAQLLQEALQVRR